MQNKLVKVYDLIIHIHLKRKHIQRKNIFSEDVFGYSLKNIAKNDKHTRKDIYTDNTKYLSNISIIDDVTLKNLQKAGYYRLSDISLVNKDIIQKETELPINAVSELYEMATSDEKVNYLKEGKIIETKNKKDILHSLVNSDWKSIILLEYTLLRWLQKTTKKIYLKNNMKSKYELIYWFKKELDNPRKHVEAISFATNTSIKYVRNVLSGRIENGLTNKERKDILERDNYQCKLCSTENNLEVHHVIPVANGGGKYPKNLCTLCSNCHFNIAHGENTSTISYETQKEFWKQIIGEYPS